MKNIKKIISMLSIFFVSILSSCGENQVNYELGTFYGLSEAFRKGFLTHEDLLNIAYYYNWEKNVNEDFEIKEADVEDLDEFTLNSIIYSHYEKIKDEIPGPTNPEENIEIGRYFGTYNGNVCLLVRDDYFAVDIIVIEEYVIDGVKFLNFKDKYPMGIELWVSE